MLNSNGTASTGTTYSSALSALQASNLSQYQLLQAAVVQGDVTKANGILAANNLAFRYVSPTDIDRNFVTGNTFYQGVTTSPQGQGNGTVNVNHGAHASTTSLAGGVVYANDKGQSTAIGPDGITSIGGTGTWTNGAILPQNRSTTTINNGQITSFEGSNRPNAGATTIDGSSISVVNATGSTTINGAVATLSSSQGTITLNANADPVVTISNAAGTSFTTVNNGFVKVVGGPTANTDGVKSLTSTNAAVNVSGGAIINNGLIANNGFVANGGSTLNGGATVNGPTQLNGSLSVAPGNNVDMGGNRVQDVGTPIFGTDAANKAYVDRGLNKAYEGTAIALAISQPIIGPNQTFAIRAGWGNYESENAFGLSAAGIIGRDWFWNGSTVALDGGVGWGSNNSVAGKAGITLAFGPGYAAAAPLPLK